jgi:endonuclease/exonuclease/phosphatase (EEP) superfamily protein YafD
MTVERERSGRRVRGVVSVALAAGAAALVVAELLMPRTSDGTVPVLHVLVAFRALVLTAVAVAAVVVALLVLVLRWRRTVVAAAVVVAVLGVAVAVLAADRTPTVDPAAVRASAAGSLRVLEWNTGQQDVDDRTIQALVAATDPDVVVLPEYFTTIARGTLAEIAERRHMQVLGSVSSSATLLVSRSLGTYRVDDTGAPPWAGFVAVPSDPTSPRLVVTHLQRPGASSTALWREHVAWAGRACRGDSIAVGDFNASVDDLGATRRLGDCVDSAVALGEHPRGTWPTVLPAALGATIDHVFVGSGWRPVVSSVLAGEDHAGSDHRPVFAVLVRER